MIDHAFLSILQTHAAEPEEIAKSAVKPFRSMTLARERSIVLGIRSVTVHTISSKCVDSVNTIIFDNIVNNSVDKNLYLF